jgi:hypothetical protein
LEALTSQKHGGPRFMRMKFVCLDGQRIAIHQIPGVPLQLAADIGNETGWAVQPECLFSAQCDPKEAVKSNEVIHVRMGDKQIIGAKEPSGTEGIILTQIKEQCSARPFYFDIQSGIAEGIIDEVAGKGGRHANGGEGDVSICGVLGSTQSST